VSPASFATITALALLTLVGCQTEQRIVRKRSWFAGLDGSQGAETIGFEDASPSPGPAEFQNVVVNEDGSRTLRARTTRHLMEHVYLCLKEQDAELLVGQVLCKATLQDFRDRGKDPREALAMLIPIQDDIVDLFNSMPFGERTPGVYLENLGDRVKRVRVASIAARDLNFVAMDMTLEGGFWKLRWFVPAGTP
jgi:hypothetical protein